MGTLLDHLRSAGRRALVLAAVAAGLASSAAAQAGVEFPPRPEQRGFLADEADLLPADVEEELRARLDQLLTDTAIPILVVTIGSLGEYEAHHLSIESYARQLFDHWGIGHAQVEVRGAGWGRAEVRSWNKGILLLISRFDRKARIELGADYGHTKDPLARKIMDQNIIPYFKEGDYAGGIVSGVKALEQMARGETITPPPRPLWHYALGVGFVLMLVLSAISLYQSGASGWAWFLWGMVFSVLGFVIWTILTSPPSSSGGGSFSGGSFGGGFSGGGGATGSW